MIDPESPDFAHTPAVDDRASFGYAPAQADAEPVLTIVTRFANAPPALLAETARSIRRQSFQHWRWLVIDETPAQESRTGLQDASNDDPRIRVVRDDRSAFFQASEFVLEVEPGDLIEPTAAEKWLWFLASHPECVAVRSLPVVFGEEHHLPKTAGEASAIAALPEYLSWCRRRAGDARLHLAEPPQMRRTQQRPETLASGPDAAVEFDRAPFDNLLTKSRRRLLMIVPFAAPGGADKFNIDLAAQLTMRGWEITAVTTLHGDHRWLPHLAHVTPDVFALSHFLAPADFPRFLRYIIESRRPDAVLISNSHFAYAALPYLREVADGIPIVDYCHSEIEAWHRGGYPRMSVDNGKMLDLHLTASAHLKSWMEKRGGDSQRIEVCYIGVEQNGSDRVSRGDLGLPEAAEIILYPCRITHEKQPRVFAKTLLELRRRNHTFLGLVAGDGPYLEQLMKFVKRHRMQSYVQFLGRQPNARVRELMSVADCVFMPSTIEGISAVFYEAMDAGCPVVGADVGGQRELVTPECGILLRRDVPRKEPPRYAGRLEQLLRDPEGRRQMGENGRRRVRSDFTLDLMGERMNGLLEHARELARSQPRPAPSVEVARTAAFRAVRLAAATDPALRLSRPRAAILRVAIAIGGPAHRLSVRLGFAWADPLKDRLATLLQRNV